MPSTHNVMCTNDKKSAQEENPDDSPDSPSCLRKIRDGCLGASRPIGQLIVGFLIAADILMAIDYVATNREIAYGGL